MRPPSVASSSGVVVRMTVTKNAAEKTVANSSIICRPPLRRPAPATAAGEPGQNLRAA